MRRCITFRCSILAIPFLLVPVGLVAQTPSIGISSGADLYCEYERDLNQTIGTPNTTVGGTVFAADATEGFFSFYCTFCVSDINAVDYTTMTATPLMPQSWTVASLFNSVDNPFSFNISPEIMSSYPNYVCWLFQATDFTFTTGVNLPVNMFSFEINANADFEFVIDAGPSSSGWFSTGFMTGAFVACDSLTSVGEPPLTRTEESSWGGVKTLFR